MYYPDGFDRRKAIQLAELIVYAYDQLEACKKGTPWKLPGDYVLVEEINYFGRQESLKKGAADQFDHELRTLGKSEVQKGKGLPIWIHCAQKVRCLPCVSRHDDGERMAS